MLDDFLRDIFRELRPGDVVAFVVERMHTGLRLLSGHAAVEQILGAVGGAGEERFADEGKDRPKWAGHASSNVGADELRSTPLAKRTDQ